MFRSIYHRKTNVNTVLFYIYADPEPHFPLYLATCNYFKPQLGKPPYRHRHHIKIPPNLFHICFLPLNSEFPETGTKIPRKNYKMLTGTAKLNHCSGPELGIDLTHSYTNLRLLLRRLRAECEPLS